jgi:sugar lactone lactonase YvrE
VKITRVDAPRCLLGEGPVWDVADQALYWLDIGGSKIHRHSPHDGVSRSFATPGHVGAMALRQGGGAVLAMKDTVCAFDFETGSIDPIAKAGTQPANAVFNDGKVDRRGRFVIGSCSLGIENPQPVGGLFGLGADHRLTRLAADITFSNGPCWSPDNRTFYFSDSGEHTCFAYDYDIDTGAVANRRPFANTKALGGMPDGATVDSDGLVWIAIFEGGKVAAFRPDGRLERVIELPVKLTVSAMFGGPDLDRLYVPTIDPTYFGREPEEGSGYLYVIEGLGARGLAEPRYAG